jgi:hypothetical protein
VTTLVAVECYADEGLVVFAKTYLKLSVARLHSFSQGEVIKDVFINQAAHIGIVDEDPGKSHHSLRDSMAVVYRGKDIELRKREGRHLIVVKPELEDCFLSAMSRVGLKSKLGPDAHDLQAVLNLPNHPKHKTFREELALLHAESIKKKQTTLVTELEDLLKQLIG